MCTHSAVVFRQCIVVQLQLCHSSAASGFKGSNQTSKPVSELLTEESFGIETAGMVQGFSAALCMLVDLHVASSVWYALQDLSHFQVVCTPRFVKLFRFFCEHLQLAPPSDRPAVHLLTECGSFHPSFAKLSTFGQTHSLMTRLRVVPNLKKRDVIFMSLCAHIQQSFFVSALLCNFSCVILPQPAVSKAAIKRANL